MLRLGTRVRNCSRINVGDIKKEQYQNWGQKLETTLGLEMERRARKNAKRETFTKIRKRGRKSQTYIEIEKWGKKSRICTTTRKKMS